jgi:hypothetical protein
MPCRDGHVWKLGGREECMKRGRKHTYTYTRVARLQHPCCARKARQRKIVHRYLRLQRTNALPRWFSEGKPRDSIIAREGEHCRVA